MTKDSLIHLLSYSSRNWATPSDPVYNEDGSWNRNFIRKANDRNPKLSAEYDYKHEKMLRAFNTLLRPNTKS